MPRLLVGLKVKILLNADGSHNYPSFSTLPIVNGGDWSVYVDREGAGWHYDHTSGHREDTPDSPAGQQWGMLLVPPAFADQAVHFEPSRCLRMTPAEAMAFYDTLAHAHEPDELFDTEILQGIKLKRDLGLALTPQQHAALDPNDDTPGIRKNRRRRFTDFAAKAGVTLVTVP